VCQLATVLDGLAGLAEAVGEQHAGRGHAVLAVQRLDEGGDGGRRVLAGQFFDLAILLRPAAGIARLALHERHCLCLVTNTPGR
jgi:hypothetical protein